MKTPKYSKNFERDWAFYTKAPKVVGCALMYKGMRWDRFLDPNGVDPKHAFYVYDSTGKMINNTDPDTVCSALACKGLGMQITVENWAEDTISGLVFPDEIKQWIDVDQMPSWVWMNYLNTCKRMALRSLGFVPKYLRLHLNPEDASDFPQVGFATKNFWISEWPTAA